MFSSAECSGARLPVVCNGRVTGWLCETVPAWSCALVCCLPLHLETYTENSGWRKRLKHEAEKLSSVCLSSARSLM